MVELEQHTSYCSSLCVLIWGEGISEWRNLEFKNNILTGRNDPEGYPSVIKLME